MAAIEEISSFAIWYKQAHESWEAPVIAIRVLNVPDVLYQSPETVEEDHADDQSPGRWIPDKPIKWNQNHQIKYTTAKDQKYVSSLGVFAEIFIDGTCPYENHVFDAVHGFSLKSDWSIW